MGPADASAPFIRGALVDTVLGGVERSTAASVALTEARQWPAAVALSSAWRVTPQLKARVGGLSLGLDDESSRLLRRVSAAGAAQSSLVVDRARAVLPRLEQAGCPCVAFKGVASIARLYGSPAARMVSDLDVLVREADVERLCSVLAGAGYSRGRSGLASAAGTSDEGDRRLRNLFVVLSNEEGVSVDVHWRMGARPPARMSAAAIIDRSVTIDLVGTPIRVASPIDSMLLTVHHAMRKNFLIAVTLRDLCDLAAWRRVQGQLWEPEVLAASAREAGLEVPLVALCRIIGGRDPDSWPEGTRLLEGALSRSSLGQVRRLVRLFDHQLTHPLNLDLLKVLYAPGQARRLFASGARLGADRPKPLRATAASGGVVRNAGKRSVTAAVAFGRTRQLRAHITMVRAQRAWR